MKMASAVMLWVALAAAARPTHHANVFAAGDKLELRVFLSPSRAPFTDFNNTVLKQIFLLLTILWLNVCSHVNKLISPVLQLLLSRLCASSRP
jgi:hypothetical protein